MQREQRTYLPDFIVRYDDGLNDLLNLAIEVEGAFRRDPRLARLPTASVNRLSRLERSTLSAFHKTDQVEIGLERRWIRGLRLRRWSISGQWSGLVFRGLGHDHPPMSRTHDAPALTSAIDGVEQKRRVDNAIEQRRYRFAAWRAVPMLDPIRQMQPRSIQRGEHGEPDCWYELDLECGGRNRNNRAGESEHDSGFRINRVGNRTCRSAGACLFAYELQGRKRLTHTPDRRAWV